MRRPAAPAYPTHVPLNGLEKGAVALLSLWGAFRNPWRGDLVASAGETTGVTGHGSPVRLACTT